MTEYVILSQNPDLTTSWEEVAKVEASSPERALRASERNLGGGVYVATPSRSWKPLTVKIEQTTKVTIG